jgi:dienelactone hydrolase
VLPSLRFALLIGLIAAASGGIDAQRREARILDAAFTDFWAADSPEAAAGTAPGIAATGADFDEVYRRLREGRRFVAGAATGVVRGERRVDNTVFPYTLDVPSTYDPARRYPVRLQLHGGVGRPEPTPRGDGSVGALAGSGEQIYVLPLAWQGHEWWTLGQENNLTTLLDQVKRTYNIDENRVVLAGMSDGATAAYYLAARQTTPYAGILPLNGFVLVLRNRDVRLGGPMFLHNLMNKPMLVVNGGQDPLYPAERVTPLMRHFTATGLDLDYVVMPEGGHNTSWWPELRPRIEAFMQARPRQPHPARLTWQSDGTAAAARAHWLVIDALAPHGAAPALPDLNERPAGSETHIGLRSDGMTITGVDAGSTAAIMGLQPGDTVTAVNGRELPAGVSLNDYLAIFDVGDILTLALLRAGAALEVEGNYLPQTRPRIAPVFSPPPQYGRVDAVREGNTITLTTRGVKHVTVLLSPDAIDFGKPVSVLANGKRVFEGRVRKDLNTLLTWAARDNDRTMLYGAALQVTIP